MGRAKRVVDALERHGIEGNDIWLFGPGAEEAAARVDPRSREMRVGRRVASRVLFGTTLGTATGAALGFVIGVLAFSVFGDGGIGGAVWAVTIAGAVALGAVGAILGGMSSLDATSAWELTHEAVREGAVAVGIHAEDPQPVAHGTKVLRNHAPRQMYRFVS